jgi:hypothetical protein
MFTHNSPIILAWKIGRDLKFSFSIGKGETLLSNNDRTIRTTRLEWLKVNRCRRYGLAFA